jgi:hypothetical protein
MRYHSSWVLRVERTFNLHHTTPEDLNPYHMGLHLDCISLVLVKWYANVTHIRARLAGSCISHDAGKIKIKL